MKISTHATDGVTILNLEGKLDTATSGQASEEINTILEEKPPKLLLNLGELEFVSSAGLRVLLRTAKTVKEQNGGMKVCGAKGVVKEVMDISGFDTLLDLHDSEAEALAAFNS